FVVERLALATLLVLLGLAAYHGVNETVAPMLERLADATAQIQ
ncbi:hypothetical protein LCGC14_2098670, partial [marine sediment metagenome]